MDGHHVTGMLLHSMMLDRDTLYRCSLSIAVELMIESVLVARKKWLKSVSMYIYLGGHTLSCIYKSFHSIATNCLHGETTVWGYSFY